MTAFRIRRFRVLAVNEVGEGESREIPESVIIKDQVEKPALHLDGYMAQKVKFRVGQTLKLKVRVAGKPSPEITWMRSGSPVDENVYTVSHDGTYSTLILKDVQREHTGYYTVKASNKAGDTTAKVEVCVLGEFFVNKFSRTDTLHSRQTSLCRP